MILMTKLAKISKEEGFRQVHLKFHIEKECGVSTVKLINRNWFFSKSLL